MTFKDGMLTIPWTGQINQSLLEQEIRMQFPYAIVAWDEGTCVNVQEVLEGDQAAIEAIITAHDHAQESNVEIETRLKRESLEAATAALETLDIAAEKMAAAGCGSPADDCLSAIWDAIDEIRTLLDIEYTGGP